MKKSASSVLNIYLPGREPADIKAKLKGILKSNEKKQELTVIEFPSKFD